MKKLFFIFFAAIIISISLQPALAHALSMPANIPEDATVVISEINPFTIKGAADKDIAEYIELYNQGTEPIDPSKVRLTRDDDLEANGHNGTTLLTGEPIASGAYRIFRPSFPLVDSKGTTISLELRDESDQITFTQRVTYPMLAKPASLQLIEATWRELTPATPNAAPILSNPIPENNQNTPGQSKACNISGVSISEIVANPAGSDGDGGEYVELYNDGASKVSLAKCELSTNKPDTYEFIASDVLAAKSYKAFVFNNGLLNSGGTVLFGTAGFEDIVEYPSLKDNQAYALVAGAWQLTMKQTPGAPNALSTEHEAEENSGGFGSLAPCPAGKFRNPETNRCKTILTASSILKPCDVGKTRNPQTNRCRSIFAFSSSLTPCKVGQYRNAETNRCRSSSLSASSLKPCKPGRTRNPETNRCRSTTSASSSLKPCLPGQERNPDTNRCRKTSALGASVINNPDDASGGGATGQNIALVAIAVTFLGFFLLYEYRTTLYDQLARIRMPWKVQSKELSS